MTAADYLILILSIVGLIDAWRGRLELWRERAETFERIRRGRAAF
jgi:hypothetical protein